MAIESLKQKGNIDTFSRLINLKTAFSVESRYHKDSNTFRALNKVKTKWVTKYEYPLM